MNPTDLVFSTALLLYLPVAALLARYGPFWVKGWSMPQILRTGMLAWLVLIGIALFLTGILHLAPGSDVQVGDILLGLGVGTLYSTGVVFCIRVSVARIRRKGG